MSSSSTDNVLILDGGMGKYLWLNGLPENHELWSSLALIDVRYHELLVSAHLAFIRAGCDVITTNNYACIPGYLQNIYPSKHEIDFQIGRLTELSVKLAHKARNDAQKHMHIKRKIAIAGSVPPLMESYRPDLLLTECDSSHYYAIIISALNSANVDLFLLETMSCFDEVKYALMVLLCQRILKPIWISFTLQDNGCLRTGEDLNEIILKLKPWLIRCPNIRCLSMNCCLPEAMTYALNNLNMKSIQILNDHQIFLGVYPNAFTSIGSKWMLKEGKRLKTRHELTPQMCFEKFVQRWLKFPNINIGMIGGCCGIMPEHIQYIARHLKAENINKQIESSSNDNNNNKKADKNQTEKTQPKKSKNRKNPSLPSTSEKSVTILCDQQMCKL
jgi:S-methylmethionine-dependent homocysteine/selenocysteine methylase